VILGPQNAAIMQVKPKTKIKCQINNMIETFTFVMGLVRVNYARSSKLFQLLHHYIQDLLLQAQNPVPTTILHKELNIKEQK
jgi:hypothetical protein